MLSRFDMSDEPAYSNSYNWRSSTKLKLDEFDQVNAAQTSVTKRDMYDRPSSQAKLQVQFSKSAPLARSVDLFSSSIGYDINSNGIDRQDGGLKSPGFNSMDNHAYIPARSLSRAETPSGDRKSTKEFARSINLGSYTSLPSSSYNYQSSRPQTAVARKGEERVKNRPPISPGRPRPQPSDTFPRSGAPANYSTQHNRPSDTQHNSSSLSSNKRALHSSINSLDNLRYADPQQLYDKYGTSRTSATNLSTERPGSRSSDVGPFNHVQAGSSLGALGERSSSANALKGLLSESRPKSALAGSLAVLEKSGTPVNARSFAGTPDFQSRDKNSSLSHSTDMNLGASYDEIIKRLRKMEARDTSGNNLRMKTERIPDHHKALASESGTHRSSAYATDSVVRKKKTTDGYSTRRVTDEFSDTDDLKDSSVYDRNSARNKDKFQYKDERKPRKPGKTAEISDTAKTYLDLSNRTGERMSAYSKNGAIESWLRSVTKESGDDLLTEQLNDDKRALIDAEFSSGDQMKYDDPATHKRSIKIYETENGYDERARKERSSKLSKDSYDQRTTSPIRQSVAKSSTVFSDSIYDVGKVNHATRRSFEPEIPLAKQERDLSSYDPNARSDSRLSLLRKYLDQADCIGVQAVSSTVDNGYLKLPGELALDDLRTSSSALDHRDSTRSADHLNGSSSRKMSTDLSYLGYSSKPAYTTMILARTPSIEAFDNKGLYSGISSSRENLDSYQQSSIGQRHENPTKRNEINVQNTDGYGFNALTSSVERSRSPTRSLGEPFTDKIHGVNVHNSDLTRLESESETEHKRNDNDYTPTSIFYDKKPLYSSIGQDLMSRSYGTSTPSDAGNAEEKKKRDASGLQLSGGSADSRTLLSILENNRKYKTVSTTESNQKPEAKYTSWTTAAELAKLSEKDNTGVDTTTFFSRSLKDQRSRIENDAGKARFKSDFNSLRPSKRVWYSEEHLVPSTGDADNDISDRFDYKPDTFRYVLRKDAVNSAVDKMPVSSSRGQERSAAAVGVRKWRSDLALFGDNLDNNDPQATAFDSRNSGLSGSFRGISEGMTPERRQVTWKDEVLLEKESTGGSSIATNGNATMLENLLFRRESSVSPSSRSFASSFKRLQPPERTSIVNDSTDLVESRSLYESLKLESPSSKSVLALAWSAAPGRCDDLDTKLKQTENAISNQTSLHETLSTYRPSGSLYESLRSEPPTSKGFLASTWSASNRDDDLDTKLKHLNRDDDLDTKLKHLNRDDDLDTKLKHLNRGDGLDTKLKQTLSDTSNPTSFHETSSTYRPSSSLYHSLRSESPSSKSFLASSWSATSGRDEHQETKPKQIVFGDSNTTSVHETPSTYFPSYISSSRLSTTSHNHSDHEPLTTKTSNVASYDDYNLTSTTNHFIPLPNDQSAYKPHTPTDVGPSKKISTYLSTDSKYKSSYSPTRYTSTAFSSLQDTNSDNLTGDYATPNSVLNTERGQTSSPYSSLAIKEFLAKRSASKSTKDEPDDVLQGKCRPVTSNETFSVSDSYRHMLSTHNYADSTHKNPSHLPPASLLESSAKEMSSTRGTYSSSKPDRSDEASLPLNLATDFPNDASQLTSTLLSSINTAAKVNSTSGLPYKYHSYSNHIAPSTNCSSTFGQSSSAVTPLSETYSVTALRAGLASSRSTSRDDLRHLRSSDSLTNGTSAGLDFLSDKHEDGLSLISETEFVVMRSGDIVKRPFKKSDRSKGQNQSRHNKPLSSARNLWR